MSNQQQQQSKKQNNQPSAESRDRHERLNRKSSVIVWLVVTCMVTYFLQTTGFDMIFPTIAGTVDYWVNGNMDMKGWEQSVRAGMETCQFVLTYGCLGSVLFLAKQKAL